MKASKSNFYAYNTQLQPFANELRHNMTKAEVCLWKFVLSKKQLKGYTFRRQRPVLDFIADFMCMELMLIIEVDGITHWQEEVVIKDEHKENALRQAGFRVLRFDDEEVLNDMENVVRELEGVIAELENDRVKEVLPPPTPASGGYFFWGGFSFF
ncbi:MAG: endonuclease domain-containing protein [Bacteroidetes bacterium]|nr:endonuclease domain-containing protein [Bacteroidota bacterium]